MEFRILGPPEVITDKGPVRLAGGRQRVILAVLLVNAHQVVSTEHLVDAVWEDQPPSTARRQVGNTVAALRRAIGDSGADEPVIATLSQGYRIRPGPGQLDAQTFAEEVSSATELADENPESAAAGLRAALQRWRGPALSGLSGRIVTAAAAKLEEQRSAAVEQCLDLELAMGRAAELIGELTHLVATHPLRERLVGQLMLALHRCGRTADALRAYQRLREDLADELGVDPSRSVQDLYRTLLDNHEARPASGSPAATRTPTPRPVPAQLPPDVAGFVGRQDYVKQLDELLPCGRGLTAVPIAVLSGTAGVGKTTLAVHWAHHAREVFPDGQLYVNLRGFDPSGSAMHPADAVRGFLDALGVAPHHIPAGHGEQIGLYRSLLAGRRVLVVLDNAREVAQVRPLLPGAPGCMALITSRSRLAGLVATSGALPISVDLPSPEEALELLARRLGADRVAAQRGAVDEIVDRCGRLPLALAVVAARAAAHPSFPLAALARELREAGSSLDPLQVGDRATDVRGLFSWSYRALGGAAARMFRLLSLLPGPDIGIAAAASLFGAPRPTTRVLLDELAEIHLVERCAPSRYRFHDLLRAFAGELAQAEETSADRRAALSRILDHYLHSAFAADRRLDPSRDPITLLPPMPGVTPESMADQAEALAWFGAEHPTLSAAVRQAAGAGLHTSTWQLAWTLVDYFDRQGLWREGVAVQTAALDAARRLDDRLVQANTHRLLGLVHTRQASYRDAADQMAAAIDLYRSIGDPAGLARTHVNLAWVFEQQGDYGEALRHARASLELHRTAGRPSGQANALNMIGWCHTQLGDHDQALAECQRALDLFREAGDQFGTASTWDSLGYAHHRAGDQRKAMECYQQALALYRQLGERYGEAETLIHLADTQDHLGNPDAAIRVRRQALLILDELGHRDAERLRAALAD